MTSGPINRHELDPAGPRSTAIPPSFDHAVWRIPGIYKADPATCARELDSLGWRRKPLTPRQILDFARDPATELHKCFEWSDEKAAEKQRLETARRLVVSLRFEIVVSGSEEPVMQRIAVHVQPSGNEAGGYMPIATVSRDEARAHEVAAKAVRDLRSWLSRYEELSTRMPVAFGSVKQAIEEIVGDVGGEG